MNQKINCYFLLALCNDNGTKTKNNIEPSIGSVRWPLCELSIFCFTALVN